jgi:peptidoglycan/LPS O-acetylase OafA/YrhL
VLKALAILAIALHNFFHLVNPAHENEFVFSPEAFQIFLSQARHPELAVQAFLSFFGHFGVQIFIFLSAYGLSKSHWDDSSSWFAFMRGRVNKLYPTFGLIVILWAVATATLIGPHQFLRRMGLQTALMLMGVSTLAGFGLPPIGPWWFIPFILQFYAIWPLLRRLGLWFGWKGLVVLSVVCLSVTYLTNPALARWNINLLLTPIGRMPGLCFGIIAARYRVRISAPVAAAAAAVLISGSIYKRLFPVTFLAALIVALWAYVAIRDELRNSRLLVRIGECSLLIFLLNAMVRNLLRGYATTPGSQLYFGFLSTAISVSVANLIARLAYPQPNREALSQSRVPGVATPMHG